MNKYIIYFGLFLSILTSCSQGRVVVSPVIDDQIYQRKQYLINATQEAYSHAEQWEVIETFVKSLNDTAAIYQTKNEAILIDESLDAYKKEREAFSNWFAYQKVIASDVVVELWELFCGGTHGGTLYEMHLYDRSNANTTEQEIVYQALTRTAFAAPYHGTATLEQIITAKNNLESELEYAYSSVVKYGDWPYIEHTADEENTYLSKDLELFQKWMSARDNLQLYLNEDLRILFSSQTGYWKDLYLQTYSSRFNTK